LCAGLRRCRQAFLLNRSGRVPDYNCSATQDCARVTMKKKTEPSSEPQSAIHIINPDELGAPSGYSNGIKAHGSLLAIAGQIGWDHEHQIVSDNLTAQFAQALDNFVTVVRAAGGQPENVIQMRLFVTDTREYTSQLKPIGEAYRQRMGHHYPA